MRYIDADAIDYDDYWWHRGYTAQECKQAERLVNEQPTADVVEVVRCKDCKHKDYCCRNVAKFDKGYDMYEGISFCSYGERREDGEIH